jgi:hypothetical protein
MGSFQKGGWTISPVSGSQSQAETECCWKGRNRRRHEEAVGGGPQSAESSGEEDPGEEKDVTRTESRIAGESGESTSGQGSEAGGTRVIEHSERQSNQRLPVAVRCWFGRRRFDAGSSRIPWRVVTRKARTVANADGSLAADVGVEPMI